MSERTADRRLVLSRLGQAGAVLGAAGALGGLGLLGRGRFQGGGAGRVPGDLRVSDEPGRPPLVVARGTEPGRLVRAALGRPGRDGALREARRDGPLVKPNMARARTPEQGANTHPDVVAEVVRQCREAGARRVIVADNPVHDAHRVAQRSGIRAAVHAGLFRLPSKAGSPFGSFRRWLKDYQQHIFLFIVI